MVYKDAAQFQFRELLPVQEGEEESREKKTDQSSGNETSLRMAASDAGKGDDRTSDGVLSPTEDVDGRGETGEMLEI